MNGSGRGQEGHIAFRKGSGRGQRRPGMDQGGQGGVRERVWETGWYGFGEGTGWGWVRVVGGWVRVDGSWVRVVGGWVRVVGGWGRVVGGSSGRGTPPLKMSGSGHS